MKNNVKQEEPFASCPIRNVLAHISDKWSLLILHTLQQNGVTRFNAILKKIPDISQKMLAVTLKKLEKDGLVYRQVYAQVPPKVEYSITERSQSLIPHINALMGWANDNLDSIMSSRNSNTVQN